MTDTPQIAQNKPYMVKVEAGKAYFWCACGRSATQPFCDDSHKVTELRPVRYKAERDGTVFFCGCKHSGNKPVCDGTHSDL